MPKLYDTINHAIETGAPNQSIVEYIAPRLAEIAMGDFSEAESAITHPLGFDSLYLARDGDEAVCLHDWCGCFNEPVPNVVGTEHEHSFDMKVRVLAGEIRDTQLTVAETGLYLPDATHVVFDTQTSGSSDTLEFLNKWARIMAENSTSYSAGDSYGFGRQKGHSSSPSDNLITLVLARNYPGTTNLSFVPVGAPDKLVPFPHKRYRINRTPLGRNRTRLLAEHIMEGLGIEMPKKLAAHPDRLSFEVRKRLPNNHVPGRQKAQPSPSAKLLLPKGSLT